MYEGRERVRVRECASTNGAGSRSCSSAVYDDEDVDLEIRMEDARALFGGAGLATCEASKRGTGSGRQQLRHGLSTTLLRATCLCQTSTSYACSTLPVSS